MKVICFPAVSSLAGGSNNSALLIAKYLDKSQYKPVFVIPGEGPILSRIKNEDLQVEILKSDLLEKPLQVSSMSFFRKILYVFKLFPYTLKARRFLLSHKVDCIHTNDLLGTLIWGFAAKLSGKPVIWHVRQLKSSKFLDKFRLFVTDYLIFVARQNMVKFSDSTLSNIPNSVIHNGIELSRFEGSRSNLIRDELGLNNEIPLIGFIGYLEPRKRPDMFIDIACSLLNNGINAHFIVVGENSVQGRVKEKLMEMVKSRGCENSFSFLGFRDDIPEIMNSLNVFAFTSTADGEAFPRVVIEAMGAGLPVVTTKSAGVIEAVDDGATGYIVEANDEAAFRHRLKKLIEDKILADRMGKKGRAKVRKMFDAKEVANKVEDVYKLF